MKNFISGAIAGATLTSIIVFFTIFEQDPKPQVSPQSVETDTVVRSDVSGENANQSEPMDPMLTGFWTNLLRNVKLSLPASSLSALESGLRMGCSACVTRRIGR